MPYHCVAYGCGKTAEDSVTLFKFPKDHEEFRKWEKQVQRTRTQWVATPNSHLCSEHFGREYFEQRAPTGPLKLKPGAAPTVFLRPHCLSCKGVGCSSCLPAIQRRGFTAEPRERAAPYNEMPFQFDDTDGGGHEEHLTRGGTKAAENNKEERPVVCEMCGTAGTSSSFFSKTKRFCSISCSRSYSSNSKKSSILARLQTEASLLILFFKCLHFPCLLLATQPLLFLFLSEGRLVEAPVKLLQPSNVQQMFCAASLEYLTPLLC